MFTFLRSLIRKYPTISLYSISSFCAFAIGAVIGIYRLPDATPDPGASSQMLLAPPGPDPQEGIPDNLWDLLQKGKEHLQRQQLDITKCGGSGTGWQRCQGDYILAALTPEKDRITTIYLFEGQSSDPSDFAITIEGGRKRARGVNVPFTITSPPGWTVLALRTAVDMKDRDTEASADHGVVYVPYTSRIDTPELRSAGTRHLESIVQQAFDRLKARKVISRYAPNKGVYEIVSPEHLITLVLTEQMYNDVTFVNGSTKERLWMLNRSLVLMGANLEDTWNYTRSGAGAVGIAQITGNTYQLLRKAYPTAKLEEAAGPGRRDHVNSAMGIILHTDDELMTLRNLGVTNWMREHPADWQLVLAAGYNANVANTVQRSVRICGTKWREEPCTELPDETKRYLIKYEWVRAVLFDEDFRKKVDEELAKDPY